MRNCCGRVALLLPSPCLRSEAHSHRASRLTSSHRGLATLTSKCVALCDCSAALQKGKVHIAHIDPRDGQGALSASAKGDKQAMQTIQDRGDFSDLNELIMQMCGMTVFVFGEVPRENIDMRTGWHRGKAGPRELMQQGTTLLVLRAPGDALPFSARTGFGACGFAPDIGEGEPLPRARACWRATFC